ncbi:HK97 family phage portal protein [Microbacterium marinum]|uniref:HK97 family phage portal protein n=1 Tax=Microbacterium marinum TaxID=421115 RepID=A0A7W7BQI6_9MICO|nr:phage portal protein [Microbacterium marinum]MBB4666974.1 HK97 family phage portal protein [Microbacterium marinum]
MSLFTREAETRDLTRADIWGPAFSGLGSSNSSALQQVAAYGAVRHIADQWAQAEITATQMRGGVRQPMSEAPQILTDPSPILSAYESRFAMVAELKTRGNAFGLVDDSRRYCQWIPFEFVTVDESNLANPVYRVLGTQVDLVKRGGNLLHIREFVTAGSVMGLSPIEQFAASFEWSGLARSFGRRFLKESSIPPAILQAKTARVGGEVLTEARDDFVRAARSGKPVALPGEWAYQRISISPEEAQFLQTIEASATEIAIIFGVPPEVVGGKAGSSRTYSNREMDQKAFRVQTLGGISGRASAAFRDVLPTDTEVTYDLTVLERPGVLESARAMTEELRNGTRFLSEARESLGRPAPTAKQIEEWQQWFATNKSESQSDATSTAITKEV